MFITVAFVGCSNERGNDIQNTCLTDENITTTVATEKVTIPTSIQTTSNSIESNSEDGFLTLPMQLDELVSISENGGCENLTLYFNDCCDISCLSKMTNLQTLLIDEASNPPGYEPLSVSLISNFTFLKDMKKLSKFTINQEPSFPLSSLTNLESLNEICLYGVGISEYNAVLNNVESLTLDSCEISLDEAKNVFPNIHELLIAGYHKSLSAIKDFSELESLVLYMTDFDDIENIGELDNLNSLELLSRKGTNAQALENVDFITKLVNLKTLKVYSGTLTNSDKADINEYLPFCDITEYDVP